MSQTLLVGRAENINHWDCVVDQVDGAREKLFSDWLSPFICGPWKIVIGDQELFEQVEPVICEALGAVHKAYPDDVWAFYLDGREISHPTTAELARWLLDIQKRQA